MSATRTVAVAQWLSITRRAVEGIRFLEPVKAKNWSANLRDVQEVKKGQDPWKKIFDEWKNDNLLVKGRTQGKIGMGLLLEPRAVGEAGSLESALHSAIANVNSAGCEVERVEIIASRIPQPAGPD